MKIKLIVADITSLRVDAIVNAANNRLVGGGGVDGAIHRAAGYKLIDACKKLNGCDTGYSKITKGFNLPAKHIIHTVGPVWHGGNTNEEQLLESCYITSLEIAASLKLDTVAFPNISTGVYGFPKNRAAKIAIKAVNDFLTKNDFPKKVVFVCFDDENYNLYKNELSQ